MDATFALKDVIYIVTGVGAAVGFYWKMIVHDKEMDAKIKQMKKDLEKNESIMFKKFTATEKTEEKNKTELDAINAEITEVKLGISTINGKLDILINK
jgi:uncharacterized membrane protein YgaE (UPF0421/DUF939 family)